MVNVRKQSLPAPVTCRKLLAFSLLQRLTALFVTLIPHRRVSASRPFDNARQSAMKDARVVIVGGGVLGLSVAFALSELNFEIILFDRAALGTQASWAGAGIISPGSKRGLDDPSVALRTESARLHASWSAELLELTGIDNGYRLCGGLDLAFTESETNRLNHSSALWDAQGIPFDRLDSHALRAFEPNLNLQVTVAYHLPGRAQIRNPWHLRALIEACRLRRVLLRPDEAITSLDLRGGQVRSVQTAQGSTECDLAVLTAGAWTGNLLQTLGLDLPTPPVKGQIVLFKPRQPLLRHIVEHGTRYLVPRTDGRILAGATEELAGFDSDPTNLSRDYLRLEAHYLCPALADAPIERTWAGLRPGSFDSLPYIGRLDHISNLFVAAGHRRQGLQLSPGTAAILADLIAGRPPRIPLDAFEPGRKPAPPTASAAFHS